MFCYSDTDTPVRAGGFNPNPPATQYWLTHFANSLYLQFIAGHADSSFADKQQANHELVLCNKKLAFWQKHPNFDSTAAATGALACKKQWQPVAKR